MSRQLKPVLLVFLFAAGAFAGEWKTSDGNLSVALPDPSRFVEVDSVAPLSVIWVSKDETIKLGVVETPFPAEMRLIRSSVEKGLAKEMNGEIVASSADQWEGHDVFTMTSHGELLGNEVYITQAVVAMGDKVYKVMAIGMGKDTRVDPDATKFMASFKILAPKQDANAGPPTNAPRSEPVPEDSAESLVDRLSQTIGGVSVLVLIGCVIVIVLLRFGKRRKSSGDHSA